jgi:hypothetical protein
MPFVGLFYVLGAVALFVIVPALALAGTWKRMEPGARRMLLTVYVVVLALFALVVWGIHHWAAGGPLA